MTQKKSSKKKTKVDEVYLPIDVYEKLLKEVEEYNQLQKRGARWVKVQVNKPNKHN